MSKMRCSRCGSTDLRRITPRRARYAGWACRLCGASWPARRRAVKGKEEAEGVSHDA